MKKGKLFTLSMMVIWAIGVAGQQLIPNEGIVGAGTDQLNEMSQWNEQNDFNALSALANYYWMEKKYADADKMKNLATRNIRDFQKKRSYWKQCAFNAVSCFG